MRENPRNIKKLERATTNVIIVATFIAIVATFCNIVATIHFLLISVGEFKTSKPQKRPDSLFRLVRSFRKRATPYMRCPVYRSSLIKSFTCSKLLAEID